MATRPTSERNSATARGLTWGGYLPFAILTLLVVLPVTGDIARALNLYLLTAYGAVILSFLGGVRWGAAMTADDERTGWTIVTSVVPSLIGWLTLTLPATPGLVLLAATFAWQYGWDRRAAKAGRLPDWYATLRLRITAAVVVTLLLAAVATL